MKDSLAKLSAVFVAALVFAGVVLAQSEAQRLNGRLGELYQKGDLDGAIVVGQEIVTIERRNSPVSKRNLTSALESLSQLKLDRMKRSMSELRAPDAKPEKLGAILKSIGEDASDIEAGLREALELSRELSDNVPQVISMKSKLAWTLYNHIPADGNQPLGFDKDSRDKIEMRNQVRYGNRFEAARALYSEASQAASAAEPSGSMAIKANFELAEFEAAMGNFEAAIPLYKLVITDAEKLLGRSNPQLITPYDSYLKALVATGQQDHAFDVLSKIVTVSGKTAQYPKSLLNLTYRAERPYAPYNSNRIEDDSRALKETAELTGRSNVARTAAAGGDIVGASISGSTHGRDYYETADAKGVKVRKVTVRVEVDEKGKVIAVEGLSSDRNLKESAEKAVRQWRFRPFALDSKPAKLKGYAEVTILSN